MKITSDLTFSVDVPGRALASGQLSAEGAHVTVRTDDPVGVYDGALGSLPVGDVAIAAVADQLRDNGITVTLTGPKGDVATAGAGVSNRVGRLLVGSSAVSLGRPAAVLPIARVRAVTWSRSHPVTLGIAAAAVAAGSWLAVRAGR